MQRIALLLGLLGGAAWIGLAFAPPECVPVTGASEVFCNRLWTPGLALMTVGFLGLRRWAVPAGRPGVARGLLAVAIGYGVMAMGNGLEYWVFSTWPHEGPSGWLRGVLWMATLAGWLLVLLASCLAGLMLVGRRSARTLTGLGLLLLIAPLLTVTIGPLAIGLLALVSCGYGLVALPATSVSVAPSPA